MKNKHKYNWTVIWDNGMEVFYRHFKTELNAYKFLIKLIDEKEPEYWYILKREEFEKEKIKMGDIVHYQRN